MRGFLRRWMIVGLAIALLAGACSDGGDQDVDEGGRSVNTPAPVVPSAPTPVVLEVGDPVVPEVSTPLTSERPELPPVPTPVAPEVPTPASGERTSVSGVGDPVVSGVPTAVALGEAASGRHTHLTVRLSEGKERDGESSPTMSRVDGEVLGDAEIRAVIDRLPPWDVDDGGEIDFDRPAESLPPPRTGRTVDQLFPAGPDIAAPVVDPGPLEVLRVQPVGEVGLAPYLSITFNQPMVPLATLGQLDGVDVPVEMTPPLPGRWQWIGTRTLRFDHDQQIFDRLPMATSYVVEVPEGTESQSGGELVETFRFEFETPPPSLVRLIPEHDSLELQPVFLATFDQRVEPSAVLDTITLSADGQAREIRLAGAAEIEGDETIQYQAGRALEGTWLAFRPVEPFEPDSAITIAVGPHVPSAEGPNTSGNSSTVEARTYAPLRVVDTSCSSSPCRPVGSLSVWFNNPLDAATVNAADFSVTPEIPDAAIALYGSELSITGPTLRGTVYRVVIPGTVGDVFGQTLGEPETVEFEIEEARPLIWSWAEGFATVDPLGSKQTVPVIVRQWEQLRVRLYAVDPSDFESYVDFLLRVWRSRSPAALDVPWPLTTEVIVDTGVDDDALTEVPIDLSGALKGEHAHVVMIVEGAGRPRGIVGLDDASAAAARDESGSRVITWVQDTDIGVDIITDHRELAVWTTDLRSGDPLAGVKIQLIPWGPPLTSNGNGVAHASLDTTWSDWSVSWVVASLGADSAISPSLIAASPQDDQTIWYTTDDRGMYRPGETLHLKGWVRNLDVSGDGDLEFFPSGTLITYTAYGPFRNELGSGEVRIDDVGGFDLTLELKEGANLGWGWIEFRRAGGTDDDRYTHSFQVQEFRRPEFEVKVRLESAGPYFIDEPAVVAVDARYFSGGALPDAEVDWTVTSRQASYSPPNWRDFTFGVWRPWWHFDYGRVESEVEIFSGLTDAAGSHYLRMDFEGDGDGLPVAVTAQARVLDVNRQRWASETDLLVHPAGLYVGVRSARTFVRAGDGIDIEAVVTDLDGNPVADRAFEVTVARLVDRYVDGEWVEVALDTETCETTSGQAPVVCEFAAGTGGRYRIAAHVVDDLGRTSRSEITRWVSGAKAVVPSRNVELEAAELIPDSETYAEGDVAEILVGSPFASATGLLTIARNRIVELRTFEITDHTAVLEVPITDDHVPELRLRVDLVATTGRTADDGSVLAGAPPRPAHASGEILLRVPPVQRTLDVTATPASAVVEPGVATSIAVEVNDAGGAPVEGASVLLIAVDEAVLALSGFELIDPIDVFYRPRTAQLAAVRVIRGTIVLENPQGLLDQFEEDEYYGGGAEAAAAESSPAQATIAPEAAVGLLVAVRENLDALALFDPGAVTDASGRVTVHFDLPDNLTRYRVMAVAVHGADRFGTGESAITARLPLQVRPSAPRFLNYGDEFGVADRGPEPDRLRRGGRCGRADLQPRTRRVGG